MKSLFPYITLVVMVALMINTNVEAKLPRFADFFVNSIGVVKDIQQANTWHKVYPATTSLRRKSPPVESLKTCLIPLCNSLKSGATTTYNVSVPLNNGSTSQLFPFIVSSNALRGKTLPVVFDFIYIECAPVSTCVNQSAMPTTLLITDYKSPAVLNTTLPSP